MSGKSVLLKTLDACVDTGYNWSRSDDFNATVAKAKFRAFFEMAQRQNNVIDIWKLPLFYEIVSYLAPWSYGLNLVRCKGPMWEQKLVCIE